MADVKLTHVKKIYSNNVEVLKDINLDIKLKLFSELSSLITGF